MQGAVRRTMTIVTARWRQAGDLPDVTHDFASFSEAADEEANSRFWGGIHYGFDALAGQDVGKKVAEYVFANYMRPRGQGDYGDWR